MHAVQCGNINLARQLLARSDIDITIQDKHGQTAFALANHEGLTAEEFMQVWGPEILDNHRHDNKRGTNRRRRRATRHVEEQSTDPVEQSRTGFLTTPLVVDIALPLVVIAAFCVTVFGIVKKAK